MNFLCRSNVVGSILKGLCLTKRQFFETKTCLLPRTSSFLSKDSSCGSKKGDGADETKSKPSKKVESKFSCGSIKGDGSDETNKTNPRKNIDSKFPCGSKKSGKTDPCSDLLRSRQQRPDEKSPISGTNLCDSIPRKSDCSRPLSIDDLCPRDCKLSKASSPTFRKKKSRAKPVSMFDVVTEEDKRKAKFWKKLTLFGALPIVVITSIIIHKKVDEEKRKPRPKYVPMEYMQRRTKRFPWGDGNHSFFHNPIRNPVPPHGYEVPDPYEIKKNDE